MNGYTRGGGGKQVLGGDLRRARVPVPRLSRQEPDGPAPDCAAATGQRRETPYRLVPGLLRSVLPAPGCGGAPAPSPISAATTRASGRCHNEACGGRASEESQGCLARVCPGDAVLWFPSFAKPLQAPHGPPRYVSCIVKISWIGSVSTRLPRKRGRAGGGSAGKVSWAEVEGEGRKVRQAAARPLEQMLAAR